MDVTGDQFDLLPCDKDESCRPFKTDLEGIGRQPSAAAHRSVQQVCRR